MTYIFLTILFVLITFKFFKTFSYNKQMFNQQLNWYISYFGEENAGYLLKDLAKSNNPIKYLNDLIRDINPELYNTNLE